MAAALQQVAAVSVTRDQLLCCRGCSKGLFLQKQTRRCLLQFAASASMVSWLWSRQYVVGEDGCQFMLRGRHLIVLRFAIRQRQVSSSSYIGGHARLDGAEIVVVQLLPLGGTRAEKGAPGVKQVGALVIKLLRDEEIFLLRAHGGCDGAYLRHPAEIHHADGGLGEHIHAAQQRILFIQRLAGVTAKGCGDIEAVILDEGAGGGVPGGVAARLKGGAKAAEGSGGVRRAPAPCRKHHDAAITGGEIEAIVLFGVDAVMGWNQWVKVVTLVDRQAFMTLAYIATAGSSGSPEAMSLERL